MNNVESTITRAKTCKQIKTESFGLDIKHPLYYKQLKKDILSSLPQLLTHIS